MSLKEFIGTFSPVKKRCLCTISTKSHLHKVQALFQSVRQFNAELDLVVLIVDAHIGSAPIYAEDEFVSIPLNDLKSIRHAPQIIQKYHENYDPLRWSLKPILMQHLLISKGYEQVIYTDNDVYYFADPEFLFQMLNDAAVIITPHWRCINPTDYEDNFKDNFTDGMFNAGFIGASISGISALDWWASVCKYRCSKAKAEGFYVDQKYLDLLAIRFENVKVIKHRGCNVAFWNQVDCKRTKINGQVLINDEYPVIFIHFTDDLIDDIKSGKDALLAPFLATYINALSDLTSTPHEK